MIGRQKVQGLDQDRDLGRDHHRDQEGKKRKNTRIVIAPEVSARPLTENPIRNTKRRKRRAKRNAIPVRHPGAEVDPKTLLQTLRWNFLKNWNVSALI